MNTLTIYEYIRNGQLRASKFGRSYRINEKDLQIFISDHLVKTKSLSNHYEKNTNH